MHELGIGKDLWKIIQKYAGENKLKKINTINIVVGETSGIDPHFLEHTFEDHIMPGTIAEGAKLNIETQTMKFKCEDCGAVYDKKDIAEPKCGKCNGYRLQLSSGNDVFIASIEGS